LKKTKKIIGLSLFANVGIAESLFSEIGVEIKVANEIDKLRAKFYSEIYPDTKMICGDITDKKIFEQLVSESKKNKVNFVIATPPCQGMSEAGKRNVFDERNQLISHTISIIKKIKPEFVFIENVPTLLKTKIIIDGEVVSIPDYVFRELGSKYNINKNTLLRAMDVGVPQMRQRNIFLMVRKDLNIEWNFPAKEHQITLKDAIGNLPSLDPLLREGIEFTIEKFPNFEKKRREAERVSIWHRPPKHSWKQVEWMMHTPSGKSAIYNEIYFPQKNDGMKIKAHHNNYRRMNWDKPSRTITQNNGVISSLCCVHPGRKTSRNGQNFYSDPRVLTIFELMIVSSLPIDWNIPTWADETFIRKVIGEGIPPLMVKKVMLELLKILED
jgi:DNA (cytosine-5)-methyltransferase 1